MRTLNYGLVALALATAACSTPQAPRDPISGNDPKPQQAVNDPSPQAPNHLAGSSNVGKPINDPQPQQSAFNDPTPQKPINDPSPQKPLFPTDNNESVKPTAAAKDMKLNDGQILAVASVANTGEVEMAELARKNASNNDVKQFAAMMMTHHRDAMSKGRTVQDKAKVQIEENDVSTTIKNENQQAMSTLKSQSGKEFDRMYINSQVKMHKDVLDAIDTKLMPNASSADVKTHLTEMRKNVASHLAKAEGIQKKLDPTMAAGHQTDKKDDAKAKADVKKATEQEKKAQPKTPDTSRSNTDKANPNEK